MDHWPRNNKNEFFWFLFRSVLSYIENHMTDHAVHTILKSMLKVFSFLVVQYQFENYEVTGVWIKSTHCNTKITCRFSKIVTIYILAVFITSVVFHHVGLSFLIESKDWYGFLLMKTFLVVVQEGNGIIK